jgi:peroxiredoxin
MAEQIPNVWSELSDKTKSRASVKIGMAVAALVLGIVSIAMAMLITGALFGLVGAIVGIVSLGRKGSAKQIAGWGLGLSMAGIVASCCFALLYYAAYVQRNASLSENEDTPTSFDKWIGTEAADFEAVDVEGNTVRLSQLRGRQVVLNFWTTWWVRDRDAVRNLIKLRQTLPAEEVAVIGISSVGARELRGVGRQMGINYPLVSAKDLPPPFNRVYSLPTTFFIDRNGIIHSVLEQYHDFDRLKELAAPPDSGGRDKPDDSTIGSEPVK